MTSGNKSRMHSVGGAFWKSNLRWRFGARNVLGKALHIWVAAREMEKSAMGPDGNGSLLGLELHKLVVGLCDEPRSVARWYKPVVVMGPIASVAMRK